MARPFLASVPLALVMIAAVIVPVALTPGTFGFHSWPTAAPERVVRDSLPAAQSPATVVIAPERRQSHGQAGKPSRAARNLVAVRTGDGRLAARGGSAPAGSPAAPAPSSGSPTAPPPGSNGPGDATGDTTPANPPATGTPALPAPATPASEAVGDAPVPPVEVAQNGDVPVLREDSPEPVSEPPAGEDDCGRWHHGHGWGHHHHERDCAEDDQEAPTAGS